MIMNTLTGLDMSAGLPSGSGNSAERDTVEATAAVTAVKVWMNVFFSFIIFGLIKVLLFLFLLIFLWIVLEVNFFIFYVSLKTRSQWAWPAEHLAI